MLDYYGADTLDPINSYGKLKKVTPPYTFNPVVTEYTYNGDGFLATEREGVPSDSGLTMPPTPVEISYGPGLLGWPKSVCNGVTCGDTEFDEHGDPVKHNCFEAAARGGVYVNCFPNPDQCDLLIYDQAYRPPAESGCTDVMTRNPNGELTRLPKCAPDGIIGGLYGPHPQTTRIHDMAYDELGRLRSASITSDEATASLDVGPSFTRSFTYNPDWGQGRFTRVGPDGTATEVWLDAAGRVETFVRKDAGNNSIMSATVNEYDAADRVKVITLGNGALTRYEYDDANRVTMIRHERNVGELLQELQYAWTPDGLVDLIVENSPGEPSSTIDFTYDNRNRLIREQRTGLHPYDITYAYDLAGNRLSKSNWLQGWQVQYVYDVQDPGQYGSQGNRLVYSRTVWEMSGEIAEERYFLYDVAGRVTYVIRKISGDVDPATGQQWYTGTQIWYNTQGLIWLAWELRWQLTEVNGQPVVDNTSLVYVSAMEYRYDSARGRYRVQRRDPRRNFDPQHLNTKFLYPYDPSLPEPDCWSASEGTWSNGDGDGIYGDYTVAVSGSTATVTNVTAHVAGLAQSPWSSGAISSNGTHYLHGNLVGTTERMTDSSSTSVHRAVYTAFGEPVYQDGTANTRYGYVGAWGYQEAGSGDPLADLGWLHVGMRYYDPSSGLFVQRDPIGIEGGLNVYVYVESDPIDRIDPDGDCWWPSSWWPIIKSLRYGPSRIGFGPTGQGIYRLAFRVGSPPTAVHIYGLKGAMATGGLVTGAAAVGAGTGIAINYTVKITTGTSLSDRIGNRLWDWFGGGPPGYCPY